MNSFKLAYKLLKNNFEIYKLYLVVLSLAVAIYYNFASIQYNDNFTYLLERMQATSIAIVLSELVLILTLIFFINHANKFFLKQRKKEIGLYMLMGISNNQIGKVFIIEGLIIGAIVFSIGTFIGLIFSKLFIMLLLKFIKVPMEIQFNIYISSIIHVLLVFSIIFIVLGVRNYIIIKRSNLLDLISKIKAKDKAPNLNYIVGIIGVLIIGVAYALGILGSKYEVDLFIVSAVVLILICIGTYLFFKSFLTIVFNRLIENKRFIYKKNRLISSSNIFFRIKNNYRSLTISTLLVASTITAFSISLSLKSYYDKDIITQCPYSLSYEGESEELEKQVDGIINNSNHKIIGKNSLNFLYTDIRYLNEVNNVDYNNGSMIMSISEVKKAMDFVEYDYNKLGLDKNEVLFSTNSNTSRPSIDVINKKIEILNSVYTIKEERKLPITGNIENWGKKNIYILNDNEYEKIKDKVEYKKINTYKITDEDQSDVLIKTIEESIPEIQGKIYGYVKVYMQEDYVFAMLGFFGIVMSIIFILACFSTLYFKILNDALIDKEQYIILKKVGMNEEQMVKSIREEIAISFILPSILGSFHSVVAMIIFQNILNSKFILEIAIGIIIFICIMIVYYFIICKTYIKMVD